MATTELTKDTFASTIDEHDIVLVDFWADWCGPCKMFAPVYERVAEANPDAVFGKVDTEAEMELAGAAGITSIPTLMIFRENVLVFAQSGALPQPALEGILGQVRALDMEEIHREVAAQSAPASPEDASSD
jgi:thioredoxin 1